MDEEEQEIHPAVALLLARMDSHPQEFLGDTLWGPKYQHFKSLWNSTEKKLFTSKIREIRMGRMHEVLMEALLK